MARAIMGTMSHEQLHGLGDNGAGDGQPGASGGELPVGESMPEPEKFPGQPDAEKSGIPSPITSAARQPGAFQGETTEDKTMSQPNGPGRRGDVIRPGVNYRVLAPSYGYVDQAGSPYRGNADDLDRKRGKLTKPEELENFDRQHPKGNSIGIADDEGNLHGSMPFGNVNDPKRDSLTDDEQKGVLDNFYKANGQQGHREYPASQVAQK